MPEREACKTKLVCVTLYSCITRTVLVAAVAVRAVVLGRVAAAVSVPRESHVAPSRAARGSARRRLSVWPHPPPCRAASAHLGTIYDVLATTNRLAVSFETRTRRVLYNKKARG
jgi:hypothetical protein